MCVQLEQSTNKHFAGIVTRSSQQIVLTSNPFLHAINFVCVASDPELKFHWLNQMSYKLASELQMK